MSHDRSRTCCAAAFFAAAAAAHGSSSLSVRLNGFSQPDVALLDRTLTSPGSPLHDSFSGAYGSGVYSASMGCLFGNAAASTAPIPPNSQGAGASFIQESFQDTITITSSDPTLTSGIMHFSFVVNGSCTSDSAGNGYSNWTARFGNVQVSGSSINGIYTGAPIPSTQSGSLGFTFGVPFSFAGAVNLGVSANANFGTGNASANFANGVFWNGITVTDANGVPVTNFSVHSDSGTDWGHPVSAPCYANCDGSTATPILNANDFQCFLNKFAAADPYANCDGSTSPPILNANDFQCFLNAFAAGCS